MNVLAEFYSWIYGDAPAPCCEKFNRRHKGVTAKLRRTEAELGSETKHLSKIEKNRKELEAKSNWNRGDLVREPK